MFYQNMLIAAKQVIMLYIIASVGFISDKTGIFPEKTAKKCTDILFYVITPAKILESFLNLPYSDSALKGLFICIGLGLLMHSVAAFGANFLFKKSSWDDKTVLQYACIYGNCGYMGLPLVEAVLGSEGVFYCSAIIISFQIFTFTHGVWLINKGKDAAKTKRSISSLIKSLILNPGVLPVFIGLPLFIFKINLPEVISSPVSSIAALNSPLAMLIFGTYLANTNFKAFYKQWKIGLVGIFKLILLPAVMFAIVKLTGLTGAVASTLIMAAATPPANNTVMFAAKYERNTSLASQTVAILSLVSIITLPVIIALSI